MRSNIIVLIFIVLLQCVSATEYDSAISIVKRQSSLTLLSVDQARGFVNQLWEETFCLAKAPSPIQKLTNGFTFLLEKLSDTQQRSLVEQAYLMWCSGRTHGFGKQVSTGDIEAMNTTRYIVAHQVALNMVERQESRQHDLTLTEKAIQNMLQENTSLSIQQQDDNLIDSIRSSLCSVWYEQFGKKVPSDMMLFIQTPLGKRSLEGIWETHSHDVFSLAAQSKDLRSIMESFLLHHRSVERTREFDHHHSRQMIECTKLEDRVIAYQRQVQCLEVEILQHQHILKQLQTQLEVAKLEMRPLDSMRTEKQTLEHNIVSLSPQVQQLRDELQRLQEATSSVKEENARSHAESAQKKQRDISSTGDAHSSPERANVTRPLFPSPSPARHLWGSTPVVSPGRSCVFIPMPYDLSQFREIEILKASQYPGLYALLKIMREGVPTETAHRVR